MVCTVLTEAICEVSMLMQKLEAVAPTVYVRNYTS